MSKDGEISLLAKIASAGAAGVTADIFTYPLDTIKVWLMVRKTASKTDSTRLPRDTPKAIIFDKEYRPKLTTKPLNKLRNNARLKERIVQRMSARNLSEQTIPKVANAKSVKNAPAKTQSAVSLIVHNIRTNGLRGLYGGITAGLQRQVAFCSVRIGCYDPIKAFYQELIPSASPESKQIPQRILAGTTSALLAVTMFQPTEVVKIRMQAQTGMPGKMRKYHTSFDAYRHLYDGGVRRAWRGLQANQFRLAVVNVSELVTYDIVKDTIIDMKLMKDNSWCHFTSAAIAGLITTIVASPIDVVKTRLMNSRSKTYTGMIHCAQQMLFKEGISSFYKGVLPAYLRLGSWNIVMFMSYEQYKRAFHENPKENLIDTEPR